MQVMFTKRGDRVEAEAAALAAARHPGVVELVDTAGGSLRTRMVEGVSVDRLGPLAPAEVAGLAASVAATLADLHDLGVVHGGIEAAHVLVRPDGHPVLCSLGRGGAPAEDVAALGHLVVLLLGRSTPEPRARALAWGLRRARLGPMLAPPAGPVLAALAAQATAADAEARPSARAFADAVGRRIPSARLPRPRPAGGHMPVLPAATVATRSPGADAGAGTPLPRPLPRPGHRWGGARGPLAATAAGVVAIVTAVAVVTGPHTTKTKTSAPQARRPASRPSAPPTTGPTATTRKTHRPGGAAGPGTSARPPVATRVWPPDRLDFHDGVLAYDGVRYALGQPGDVLVAGDWRCTGRPTLALLHRHGGEVFAFDRWPEGEEEVMARAVGRVEGATDLRAVDADGDGCDELEVSRPGAPPVHLRVAP